jgi:hypothetical protein
MVIFAVVLMQVNICRFTLFTTVFMYLNHIRRGAQGHALRQSKLFYEAQVKSDVVA